MLHFNVGLVFVLVFVVLSMFTQHQMILEFWKHGLTHGIVDMIKCRIHALWIECNSWFITIFSWQYRIFHQENGFPTYIWMSMHYPIHQMCLKIGASKLSNFKLISYLLVVLMSLHKSRNTLDGQDSAWTSCICGVAFPLSSIMLSKFFLW